MLALWVGGFVWFMLYVMNYDTDFTTKTEAVVVFTGGSARVAEGFRILNLGLADQLFISGVSPEVTLQELLHHHQQENIYRVEIGKQATNTVENAIEVQNWIGKRHVQSIRLVTAHYHILRSLIECQSRMPQLIIIPHPITPLAMQQNGWWSNPELGYRVLLEYNKFLFVFCKKVIGL